MALRLPTPEYLHQLELNQEALDANPDGDSINEGGG